MAQVGLIYASSLFFLCEENKLADRVFKDYGSFVDLLNENDGILKVLTSPVFDKKDKKDLIDKLLSSSEVTFKNFIKVLIDKGRESLFFDSYQEFKKLYFKKENKIVARIFTAFPLSDEQLKMLKEIIGKRTNKKVIIEEEIDKDLIMGLKVFFNGNEIDMSLNGSFKRLEENLKKRIEVSG